jgi:hypothetical protein
MRLTVHSALENITVSISHVNGRTFTKSHHNGESGKVQHRSKVKSAMKPHEDCFCVLGSMLAVNESTTAENYF